MGAPIVRWAAVIEHILEATRCVFDLLTEVSGESHKSLCVKKVLPLALELVALAPVDAPAPKKENEKSNESVPSSPVSGIGHLGSPRRSSPSEFGHLALLSALAQPDPVRVAVIPEYITKDELSR